MVDPSPQRNRQHCLYLVDMEAPSEQESPLMGRVRLSTGVITVPGTKDLTGDAHTVASAKEYYTKQMTSTCVSFSTAGVPQQEPLSVAKARHRARRTLISTTRLRQLITATRAGQGIHLL